jgi:hypothetical protein
MTEIASPKHLAAVIDVIRLGGPEHQAADGISETAARHARALALEAFGGAGIGSEKQFKRRTIANLRIQLAGCAKGEQCAMTSTPGAS